MSQALYTSMSGLNAATQSISVVSNNVANINTTAFKAASARFENLFSRTLTTGNSPTRTTGGVNPMQIGMGTQVGSIVRNFTGGTFSATGVTTDLMIAGGGYFTVMNDQGEVFLTRDGGFTFDANGNMVTQSGLFVLGAEQLYNTSGSQTTVKVPPTLFSQAEGSQIQTVSIKDLNDCDITAGTFSIEYRDENDTIHIPITITDEMLDYNTNAFVQDVQKQIDTVMAANGKNAGDIAVGFAGDEGAISFQTTQPFNKTVAQNANIPGKPKCNTYQTLVIPDTGAMAGDESFDNLAFDGSYIDFNAKIKDAVILPEANLLKGDGNPVEINGKPVFVTGVQAGTYGNTITGVAVWDNDAAKWVNYSTADGNFTAVPVAETQLHLYPTMDYKAGTSNFLEATRLASAAQNPSNGMYQTKVLDYTVTLAPPAALSEAVSVESYAVGNNGTIEVTYSNGDKITAEPNSEDNTFGFKYTTSTGVVIRGADHINIQGGIAKPENFVMQLATVTNEAGLVSRNNNLWSVGPNCGAMVYAVGGAMGCGEIQSGGLEASNVDLSQELANMILAQRAVQANSRVFSTASTVMETLSQLGR